jgi:hypothetical protein
MSLEYQTYERIPFTIQAVEITRDNFDEIAALIGVGVEPSPYDDGERCILVDSKKIQKMPRAFLGNYLTKSGSHFRLFTRRVFSQQYTQSPTTEGN